MEPERFGVQTFGDVREIVNDVKRFTTLLPYHDRPADAVPAPGSVQEMIMKLPENDWNLYRVLENYKKRASPPTRRSAQPTLGLGSFSSESLVPRRGSFFSAF